MAARLIWSGVLPNLASHGVYRTLSPPFVEAMKVDSGMLRVHSVTPPIIPGSLPSSEASTCTRPRSRHGFGVGLGLVEGAADPDDVGDEVVVAAGVGVRRGVETAVGDGVAPTPAQPARRIAAIPRPSNVLRDGLGRRVIRTPIEMLRSPRSIPPSASHGAQRRVPPTPSSMSATPPRSPTWPRSSRSWSPT